MGPKRVHNRSYGYSPYRSSNPPPPFQNKTHRGRLGKRTGQTRRRQPTEHPHLRRPTEEKPKHRTPRPEKAARARAHDATQETCQDTVTPKNGTRLLPFDNLQPSIKNINTSVLCIIPQFLVLKAPKERRSHKYEKAVMPAVEKKTQAIPLRCSRRHLRRIKTRADCRIIAYQQVM